jgi:hypothetical protein
MGKKKLKKDTTKKNKPSKSTGNPPSFDRRTMEKVLSDITKLLDDHEFGSIDEANAFLEDIFSSGAAPSSSSPTPLKKAQDLMYDA